MHNLGLGGGPNFRWQYNKLRNYSKGFADLVMKPAVAYTTLD